MVKKETKMIKQFIEILERMRHLNPDQKDIFYFFVFEDSENISLLSKEEKAGLFDFVSECWSLITKMWPKNAVDDDFPHISDQLYELYTVLAGVEGPCTVCRYCGWINGRSKHIYFPYKKQFEENPEICPVCGKQTIVYNEIGTADDFLSLS